MNVETQIKLDRFQPRPYQRPVIEAFDHGGYKKVIACMPRRSGKDVMGFNYMIRQAMKKVAVYYYLFPTFAQARKAIWNTIMNDGRKVIDFLPDELVASINNTEMRITLVNGSQIQFCGSNDYDRLLGTNPQGIIYSEYATMDSRCYQFLKPILLANDGWQLLISTPRGHNHFWELFQIAKNSDDWFCYFQTIDDTQHMSIAQIEKEINSGEISRDTALQEYWCSFEFGQIGSYYQTYLDKMNINGQIGMVPWEPNFPVHTSWDLGMRDSTVILFFQAIGSVVRIIDVYENHSQGLQHYAKILSQKDYTYGKHIAPHDIAVRELGTGMSRLEQARQLGIKFVVAPNLMVEDGIEAVRNALHKIWIDDRKCAKFIKAIENYRKEFDDKKMIYKDHPLHDWTSHWADALRYLAVSLPKTRDGLTAESLDSLHREAIAGPKAHLPPFFRDDTNHRF